MMYGEEYRPGEAWGALCVHTQSRFWHEHVPEEVAIAWGLELLRRCDAVVLAGDWWLSRGTYGEVCLAVELGIPVFECHDEIDDCRPMDPEKLLGSFAWHDEAARKVAELLDPFGGKAGR